MRQGKYRSMRQGKFLKETGYREYIERIIDSPPEKTDPNWTQSSLGLPLSKIVHSGVETFFEKNRDKNIKQLEVDLEKSKSPLMLLLAIKTAREAISQNIESKNSPVAPKVLPPLPASSSKQGSER